jgi:hypothetical protein
MNDPKSDADLDALFARARVQRADTSAMEYGFETRLMARLREERSTSSIWAMISWRMMPFFALCVLGLAIWQEELVSEAHDAEQVAYAENPDSLSVLNFLN